MFQYILKQYMYLHLDPEVSLFIVKTYLNYTYIRNRLVIAALFLRARYWRKTHSRTEYWHTGVYAVNRKTEEGLY